MKDRAKIKPFECVVVGASWGGIEAVGTILSQLPAQFPLPILVVLHQHRKSGSHITSIFASKCPLQVREVEEKVQMEPGTVYVAPANYHVLVEKGGSLSLSVEKPVHYSRPSIDVSFISAAESYRDTLIGILLTGANQDGAEGLAHIKHLGGLVIIENPESAKVATMPQSALKLTPVDQVLHLDDIARFLLAITVGVLD